jgi:DNA-binding Lrp family transcriptional regulator
MIRIKYPNIEEGGLTYLANCSKLVPRVALRYAEQLTKMHPEGKVYVSQVEAFIKGFLNMDLTGIDGTDKRILMYLSNNKKAVNPSDEVLLTGFRNTLARLDAKGLSNLSNSEHREYNKCQFNISVLENKINNAEYVAKSRQDISLACRLLDLNDLETRLSFLEKLNMVNKTPKGIMLSEIYRN